MSKSVILGLAEDVEGRLWIGTSTYGLFVLNEARNEFTRKTHDPAQANSVSSNKISKIFRDRQGQLWIGTSDAGLNLWDQPNNRFIHYRHHPSDPHGLSENVVHSIYEDNTGVLWVGAYSKGISKFNPYGFTATRHVEHQNIENPDPHTDIRAFLVDREGSLWVGSSNNGVRVIQADGQKRVYKHAPNDKLSLSSNRIYSFYEDKSGTVWVGAFDGWLNQYDRKNDSFTRYHLQPKSENSIRHGKVRSMLEDKNGIFWVALGDGGLHTFDRTNKAIKHYHHDPDDMTSLSDNRIFTVSENRNGDLWLATYGGGLNKFDQQTQTFFAYTSNESNKQSLKNNFILSILEDQSENVLWLGMSGGGFDRFDLSNKIFINYNEKDGLPDNTVYGILQDTQGQLWMSHNKGISRFNPKTNVFYNYDQQEGLQSNEYNGGAYYKSADGKFFFGGINGYNAFHPEKIIDNPHKPPVYITGFQLFNQPVSINELYNDRVLLPKSILDIKTLTLSYKDSVFSFEFAGLDYVNSNRNQYAYKMEGLDKQWNYVDGKRRFATYTTLSPGEYRFRVRASNSYGLWNQQGASLDINITPPFWQTWWFRTASILFLLSSIYIIYHLRVASIRKRNIMLKSEVKARTAELQKEKITLEKTLMELSETKDALIDAAHKAGMADTAQNVMHNVGNLLNSVNVSSNLIIESIDNPISQKYIKASDALLQHKDNLAEYITNNEKGKKVLNYLLMLKKSFEDENKTMRDNAHRLRDKVESISEVIVAQQEFASDKAFLEERSLKDIIEDSLKLQEGSIGRHHIKIIKHYDEAVPKVNVQKSKLIQVLINLYKNAKESMDDHSEADNIITIDIKCNENSAYIYFSDTGLGIEQDALETIFSHGYTTKPGQSGYGLHNCANYMTEMGGKIWAESKGPGLGSTFIMQFPLSSGAVSLRSA